MTYLALTRLFTALQETWLETTMMTAELLHMSQQILFQSSHKRSAFSHSALTPLNLLDLLLYNSDASLSLTDFLSIIPSSLPGLIDINLEHSHFLMFLHVALHMSEQEALWPTSISVTGQDLWEMESKPNSSESVLMKPTPGPLCNVIDEHPTPSTST